jgi:hypothetical protein
LEETDKTIEHKETTDSFFETNQDTVDLLFIGRVRSIYKTQIEEQKHEESMQKLKVSVAHVNNCYPNHSKI